eukprot:5451880-Amphidinium_carterae.1
MALWNARKHTWTYPAHGHDQYSKASTQHHATDYAMDTTTTASIMRAGSKILLGCSHGPWSTCAVPNCRARDFHRSWTSIHIRRSSSASS